MTPQASLLNEGIWVWLEKLVRDYAQGHGEVFVLTGSVLQSPIRTVPSENISIPRRYYKIILRTTSDGTLEALTIVLPNLKRGLPLLPGSFLSGPKLLPAEADAYLAAHTASIREVENLTGLDLLPEPECRRLEEGRGVRTLAEELTRLQVDEARRDRRLSAHRLIPSNGANDRRRFAVDGWGPVDKPQSVHDCKRMIARCGVCAPLEAGQDGLELLPAIFVHRGRCLSPPGSVVG